VCNIVDGVEGDTVQEPDSLFQGQRLKNGWKNSGCPWTYKLTPERMTTEPKTVASGPRTMSVGIRLGQKGSQDRQGCDLERLRGNAIMTAHSGPRDRRVLLSKSFTY
jgi:hypothetical protein